MNNYIITVFRDVHTRDYYHKICIYDMALLYSRLNTGSEQPVKSLKSPQCGDFLQTLVKGRRHWFVAMKTTNAKIPLEKRRFCTGAGTSSVPKFAKGEQYERRI